MRRTTAFIVALGVLTGCASQKLGTVIPQPDGMYQVMGTGAAKNDALEMALHTAETTCRKVQRRHVVLAQNTKYKGLVSEDANATLNKASEFAAAFAGAWLPTLSNDDDYQVTLAVRCDA